MEVTIPRRGSLTAKQAIYLAEQAMNSGRMETAICYVNVAYAILDDTVVAPTAEDEAVVSRR